MPVLVSKDNQADGAQKNDESDELTVVRLSQHIRALETELAHYASNYGLTDKARELPFRPIVK